MRKAAGSETEDAEKVESEMLLQSVEDETTLAVPTDQSVVCSVLTPPVSMGSVSISEAKSVHSCFRQPKVEPRAAGGSTMV